MGWPPEDPDMWAVEARFRGPKKEEDLSRKNALDPQEQQAIINEIPEGMCQCGCGQPAPIAKLTDKKRGYVKGKPRKFISGHQNKGKNGKANSHWKGGRRVDGHGYVWILKPDHPRVNKVGYVREHIIVMEEVLGRSILPTEAIHHINQDRSDNSPGNLMLFSSHGSHRSYHNRLNAFEVCGHYDWRKCFFCHQYDDPSNLTLTNNRGAYHKSCKNQYDMNRKRKNKERLLDA